LHFRWNIVALLLLAAGCAHFNSQPISPAETAARFDSRSLDDPGLKAFLDKNLPHPVANWPLKSWDFDTLTLVAFYYHPSLDLARAQWRTAMGGEVTAAARPNPTVSAIPGYDFSATGGVSPWIPAIVFDIPIETGNKRQYRKAQAQQLSESARLNIAATAWQVRDALRLNLIDYAAASQRVELLQRQTAVQERVARALEQELQAGAVSTFELSQSQIALSKSRIDLADARRDLADSRVRVADSIGVSVKSLEGAELHYDLASRQSAATELMSSAARDEALRHRADIQSALSDYAASQSALQLEIAKQYPDVHLGPGYQYDQGDHKFTLAITAEMPIFNQNQGPIAEATAKRLEAAARFDSLQAKVISEIDRAVAGCKVTSENLSSLEMLGVAREKQAQAIEAERTAGAADQLDVANSQLELVTGDLVLLDGRMKLHQSYAALEDALRRPLDTPPPPPTEQSPRSQAMTKQFP
jgi:outer membrane protein TolC